MEKIIIGLAFLFTVILIVGCNPSKNIYDTETGSNNEGIFQNGDSDTGILNENSSNTGILNGNSTGDTLLDVNVDISNFSFNPSTLNISSGQIVIWKNNDSEPHQVGFTIGGIEVKSKILNNGDEFSYKFNNTGTINYICPIHPGMTGRIIVK